MWGCVGDSYELYAFYLLIGVLVTTEELRCVCVCECAVWVRVRGEKFLQIEYEVSQGKCKFGLIRGCTLQIGWRFEGLHSVFETISMFGTAVWICKLINPHCSSTIRLSEGPRSVNFVCTLGTATSDPRTEELRQCTASSNKDLERDLRPDKRPTGKTVLLSPSNMSSKQKKGVSAGRNSNTSSPKKSNTNTNNSNNNNARSNSGNGSSNNNNTREQGRQVAPIPLDDSLPAQLEELLA